MKKFIPDNEVGKMFLADNYLTSGITKKIEPIELDPEVMRNQAYKNLKHLEGVDVELTNEVTGETHKIVLLDTKRPEGWYLNVKNRNQLYSDINDKLGRIFKDLRTFQVNDVNRDQVAIPNGTYAPAEPLLINAGSMLTAYPKQARYAKQCLEQSMAHEIEMIEIMCKGTKLAIEITASVKDLFVYNLQNKLAIAEHKTWHKLAHAYGIIMTQAVRPTLYNSLTVDELLGAMCQLFITNKPWYNDELLPKKERFYISKVYSDAVEAIKGITVAYPTEETNRFAGKDLTALRQNMINYKAIIEGDHKKEEKITAVVMMLVSVFGIFKSNGEVNKHWYEF